MNLAHVVKTDNTDKHLESHLKISLYCGRDSETIQMMHADLENVVEKILQIRVEKKRTMSINHHSSDLKLEIRNAI